MDPAVAYLFCAQSRGQLHLAVLLFASEGKTFTRSSQGLSLLVSPKPTRLSASMTVLAEQNEFTSSVQTLVV